MKYPQRSFDQLGLHFAATAGNDEAVARALEHGADVNSLDSSGKTALMCAVAGEHWQNIDASDASFMTSARLNTIRLLLKHPEVSLLTLNSPQNSMNGVIPLSMAAWLNMEKVVRILLEESSDTVSVDGMDSHGATALMYAARDGNLGVVQLLLAHGARPDLRDCNHRTSIQFALDHPQVLWLCESILRRHRWRESQSSDRTKLSGSEDLLQRAYSSMPFDSLEPPPLAIFTTHATSKLTDTLIDTISSSDLSFLHSLILSPALPPSSPPALYPMSAPVLVNRPDAKGWSPIHYLAAAAHPSIDILDSLYCAGAEVTLFTTHEQYTPLHILARFGRISLDDEEHALALYHFIVHLIRDLRAPLAALDRNDETCIHVAAAQGSCINLLMVLLDFDTTNAVREMRNAQGLTALEVAKPEFRAAFTKGSERLRSLSSVKPQESSTSLDSLPESYTTANDDIHCLFPSSASVDASTHQLLSCLRSTSPSADHSDDLMTLDNLSNLLSEATLLSENIVHHFRSRVREAAKELQVLRSDSQKIHSLLDQVTHNAIEKAGSEGFDTFFSRKTRDSEDSELTMFNHSSRTVSTTSIARTKILDGNHVSVATQTNSSLLRSIPRATTWPEWLDSLKITDASAYSGNLTELAAVERELSHHRRKMASSAEWNGLVSLEMDEKLKQLEKRHRKLQNKVRQLEAVERKNELHEISSPKNGKFTKWIKRIIAQDKTRTFKLQIVLDIDEQDCAVARQVKPAEELLNDRIERVEVHAASDLRIVAALRTSNVVLSASKRDLNAIGQCLTVAEQFLERANQSITRVEHVVRRAIKKRETMIQKLRTAPARRTITEREESATCGGLGHSLLSLRPSFASLCSVNSAYSSIAPTLIEHDDDDTRIIRRLLLRKIEAGIVGSWDEMDKAFQWVGIVKEAVLGVKRRAYL